MSSCPGDPADRAQLRQHRCRDRQGVVAALGDPRRPSSCSPPRRSSAARSRRWSSTPSPGHLHRHRPPLSAPAAGGSSAASGYAREAGGGTCPDHQGLDEILRGPTRSCVASTSMSCPPTSSRSSSTSGSGKTTLLRCVDLLEEYDGGEIAARWRSSRLPRGGSGRRYRLPGRELARQRGPDRHGLPGRLQSVSASDGAAATSCSA